MTQSFSTVRDDQSSLLSTSPYIGPGPTFRGDPLDAARSLYNRDPGAHYPDGYVSSAFTTRHADKVAGTLWRNQRSYTRGVHKGERLDQGSYFWPEEFNLMSGLQCEATGSRFFSLAMVQAPEDEQATLMNDGRPTARDFVIDQRSGNPAIPDPVRAAALRRLAPTWG